MAGSIRRMRETVADVDIPAGSVQPEKVMDAFAALPQAAKINPKPT